MTPLEHRKLIDTLARHKVPFVIIGGHAVNYHGHQRGTQDVDVIWLRGPDAEAALVNALREVNACWVSNEITRQRDWKSSSRCQRATLRPHIS